MILSFASLALRNLGMHVIWRRPDGFHGSVPADFYVIDIDGSVKIWLHESEQEYYPFQIAGGWQEEESTRRLNFLANLLKSSNKMWLKHLLKLFNDSLNDSGADFFNESVAWLNNLCNNIKGDKWEVEIMQKVIGEIKHRLFAAKEEFIQVVS